MEIIVLRISNYKDKDGIVEAINESGQMSFLVRGIFDPKSKNALLNNPLTIADVELSESKGKYLNLKSSYLIESPINPLNDLKYMASLMMIIEATNYLLSEEEKAEIYPFLKKIIHRLKNKENPLIVVLDYLCKIIKISGYDFEINRCVNCGNKKNIVTFSFNEGGFICQNCYNASIPKLFNKNQMLLIRDSFSNSDIDDLHDLNDEEITFILLKLTDFIFDSYGHKMKSIDLLK